MSINDEDNKENNGFAKDEYIKDIPNLDLKDIKTTLKDIKTTLGDNKMFTDIKSLMQKDEVKCQLKKEKR